MYRGWVYILTNRPIGVLYTGMTANLVKRVWEHRTKAVPGFTRKYNCIQLAWFEPLDDVTAAAAREKRIKGWRRAWKIELIENFNPGWKDLWFEISRNAGAG